MSHRHYLTIDDDDELRLRLVCTATPDAPCRKRPSDDRETWDDYDPDLTSGNPCWAVEWAEEGGWESVAGADGVEWPRIPVTIEYDEGVLVAPVFPEPILPFDGSTDAPAGDCGRGSSPCGHTFRIRVEGRMHSSGVISDNPPVHSDANWWHDDGTVEVRAHNMRDALLLAAALPLTAWPGLNNDEADR